MFGRIIQNVREKRPLIHCITNYVTAGDVANMLLALGGSPIMANGINEVEEITDICQGLVLNIGTLDERIVDSMSKAGRRAAELGHPVVFDPVGVGTSVFRRKTAVRIITELPCTVIRGNVSEIKILAAEMYREPERTDSRNPNPEQTIAGEMLTSPSRGVDAGTYDRVTEENLDSMCRLLRRFSNQTGAVIAMTGAIDLIGDSDRVYVVRNGHPMMAEITGTGCMLDAVAAACVCANRERILEAAAAAVAVEGICGELAYTGVTAEGSGLGSFRMKLFDFMGKMDDRQLEGGANVELR